MPALALALVILLIAEIYVMVAVGAAIGASSTIVLLIAGSALGAWIVEHEGRRAWLTLTGTLQAGRAPTKELADGAVVLVAGALLIVPGFLTDAVGLLLLLPVVRPVARTALIAYVSKRVRTVGFGPPGALPSATSGDGRVVSGEVVDDGGGPNS